ncbi:MAG: DMT family transporter [Eubacteriales bacterium]|nr:DMT family transporter [Eubacteriales bacterium]
MKEKNNNAGSLLMFVVSALIFGTIGLFRRFIPISSSLLAFFRGVIGSVFLFIFIKLKKRPFGRGIGRKKVIGLIVTGALIGLNWVMLFEAYNYTSVATATLCYYMEPTIVMFLSPLLFHEKLTGKKIVCIVVSVVGMVFVSGVADSGLPGPSELKGILFGLAAACLYSAVVILNKKLPGIDMYDKTIIQLFSAALIMIPYILILDRSALSGVLSVSSSAGAIGMIALILVVGLVHTGIAYALYFGSMDGLKTQTIALLSYLDPVTALLLSVFVLREPISTLGIIGAVLIIAAAIFGEIGE